MREQNLVAVFSSRAQAEAARARLLESGVAEADIRLSADPQAIGSASTTAPTHEHGFLDWLFGSDIPEEDRNWYGSNLREGRTALSVHLRGEEQSHVHGILEAFDPIDVEEEGLAPLPNMGFAGASTGTAMRQDQRAAASPSAPPTDRAGEQVVPVTKEELDIGKRQTERRYRVRTYVIERPVEEQIHLRDERVVVERRPVSGERATAGENFKEREFEVVERHEEPVVAKKTRAVEEVVLRKDVRDRVETVRDTVREIEVDVDKGGGTAGKGDLGIDRAAAGNKPAAPLDPLPGDDKARDRVDPMAPERKS
ncbi:MAG: YsnF/AvaK domain-containing protein [Alphaproteobacteria bacterium]|nr:YsnF/AvaK domain-containing protein [Alphaproteobacteria bacterium]